MKARELLAPIVAGVTIGGAGSLLGITTYEAYLRHEGEIYRAESLDDFYEGQRLRQEEMDLYFEGMDHLDVQSQILHDGFVLDLTIELVPENIDELSPEIAQDVRNASVRIKDLDPAYEDIGYRGSGFLFTDEDGQVKLVTAGHVANGLLPHTISAHTDNGVFVDVERFESYYQPAQANRVAEDFAIGTLRNPEAYRHLALSARDLEANPLRPGEELFLTNFQDGHQIGDAVQYSLIYTDEIGNSGPFISAIGDVMPNREEDDQRRGASGGIVTDNNGEVVGISASHDDGQACGEDILIFDHLFGREHLIMEFQVPESVDECSDRLSVARIRRIDDIGTFITRNAAVEEIIPNEQAA